MADDKKKRPKVSSGAAEKMNKAMEDAWGPGRKERKALNQSTKDAADVAELEWVKKKREEALQDARRKKLGSNIYTSTTKP